jgi:hypothetical protein
MFWKTVGGIVTFFVVVAVALALLATGGLVAAGATVGAIADSLDVRTVEVTDSEGVSETYDVNSLVDEGGRIEFTGENGDRVTFDLDVPRLTIRERGKEGTRVVIGGDPEFVGRIFDENFNMPSIRVDGRDLDHAGSGIIGRAVGGFFKALFNVALWTAIAVSIWLVLRSRRAPADESLETKPNATA